MLIKSCSNMSQRFKDRVTLVTGGSKGIGKGIVKVFVENGAKVCFCDRDEKFGKILENELNSKYPGHCLFVKCDVTNEEEVKGVVSKTLSSFGRINCLINNAGLHPADETIDNVTAKELQDLFKINVVNYFLFAKYAAPYIRKVKGSIINIASLVASIGQPNAITYVTSKGAIIAMTKAMAIDEAKYGVRVNSISPGNVWTSMWQLEAGRTADPDSYIKNGAGQQLLGRFGTPEEFGHLALYIAAEATFTTGVDFLSAGGAELNMSKKNEVSVQVPSHL